MHITRVKHATAKVI